MISQQSPLCLLKSMILLATTREPVAQLPGAKRLDRIYKAVAAVFMPQASSVYAFLALSIASGIEETPLYLLLAILFASLIELGSLLVYVRFLKRDVNVQDSQGQTHTLRNSDSFLPYRLRAAERSRGSFHIQRFDVRLLR